jgi:pyruvate dehydrogenase E2 component (dihydrolipoamide acetyltransferase)
MPVPVTIPRLGWNMEEGVFAGWLRQDGETIRPGDALFSLESDKATEDIESLDGGILRVSPDGPQVGAKVAVGTLIGYIVQPGESVSFSGTPPDGSVSDKDDKSHSKEHLAAGPAARRLARDLGVDIRQVAGSAASGRVTPEDVRQHLHQFTAESAAQPAISPRARRIATEVNVDWTRVNGSGKTGRIRERDIRAAVTTRPTSSSAVPLSSTRRITAERMLRSARSTAPVTLTTEADVTNLVNLRGQFQAALPTDTNAIPTYTDFFVKLAAIALKQHPNVNVRWDEGQLVAGSQVNVGVAVDTEAGLLVPVVRDVSSLGLRQLATRTRDLIDRARQRKLSASEMQDGTFTVSSLGAFGIDAFTPIINYPEIAILGVGRIKRQPVVTGDQVIVREMVTLNLTFDHCAVDGAPAARFLQTLCKVIETPGPWLMP